MNDLKWEPFIGKNFEIGISQKKILIVGESHFHNGSEKSIKKINKINFTKIVIKEMAIKKEYWSTKFFQNLHRTLVGSDNFKGENLWDYLAFYNFIQRPMETNKERPRSKDFLIGWNSFFYVIKEIKPDICIFIGTSPSHYFSEFKKERVDFKTIKFKRLDKIGNSYPRYAKILRENNEIEFYFIKHTSSYYSWKKWRAFLEKKIPDQIAEFSMIDESKL
ncbi:hypothetical protein [Psychroflexus tropicus]|uniref:hypothetical protein n=1 Tax=Psychroflexus tropicus TaxID=197345 RepID=UPI00036221F2|nr:hypothetical protein [Psychroflexus tropicus]